MRAYLCTCASHAYVLAFRRAANLTCVPVSTCVIVRDEYTSSDMLYSQCQFALSTKYIPQICIEGAHSSR